MVAPTATGTRCTRQNATGWAASSPSENGFRDGYSDTVYEDGRKTARVTIRYKFGGQRGGLSDSNLGALAPKAEYIAWPHLQD